MDETKRDATEIKEFIDKLENEPKIKESDRSFWPKFIFHYTPLKTAVQILKDGKLKSRYNLEKNNELLQSIGSRDILERTAPDKLKYVRMYFRPRTPTQYHAEGIRPKKNISDSDYKVHCPVPIFFLFDSRELLTRKDAIFTNGNISSCNHKTGDSAEFLKQLPFDKIYHLGAYNPDVIREITFHRCAEVLYPDELDLSSLKYICCRSEAEKDTLLNLLPVEVYSDWYNKIFVSRKRLFEAKWTYLEKVQLLQDEIIFNFSPDSKTPGPFEAIIHIIDTVSGRKFDKHIDEFFTNTKPYLSIPIPEEIDKYSIKFYLDDNLCYSNEFNKDDLPI